MLQLSSSELDTLPKDTPIYDGVGKMSVGTKFAEGPETKSTIGLS